MFRSDVAIRFAVNFNEILFVNQLQFNIHGGNLYLNRNLLFKTKNLHIEMAENISTLKIFKKLF